MTQNKTSKTSLNTSAYLNSKFKITRTYSLSKAINAY